MKVTPYIFMSLAVFFSGKCLAGEVGEYYIKRELMVVISVSGDELSVVDKSTYSLNRWLTAYNHGAEDNTIMVHASIIRDVSQMHLQEPLIDPKIKVANGTTQRVVRFVAKLDSDDRINYLIQIGLSKDLPETFDFSVEYKLKLDGGHALLSYSPFFENEEFIPPIFFSNNSYKIEFTNGNYQFIKVVSNGDSYTDNGITIVDMRNRNHHPVVIEIGK